MHFLQHYDDKELQALVSASDLGDEFLEEDNIDDHIKLKIKYLNIKSPDDFIAILSVRVIPDIKYVSCYFGKEAMKQHLYILQQGYSTGKHSKVNVKRIIKLVVPTLSTEPNRSQHETLSKNTSTTNGITDVCSKYLAEAVL